MPRRPVPALVATAVVAAALTAVSSPTVATPPPGTLSVRAATAFSPDGDGTRDRLPVRIALPSAAEVTVRVTRYYGQDVVRTVRLGQQPAGVTTWRWSGRSDGGRTLADGPYVVTARVDQGTDAAGTSLGVVETSDIAFLDTEFEPWLTSPTFGVAEDKATYRVFPRSTAVTDAVQLGARVDESEVSDLRLVIRDDSGRVVRSSDVNKKIEQSSLGQLPDGDGGYTDLKARGRTVAWTARRGGRPLPRGRYTAVVTGRDRAGNSGRSETLRLWVSADKLEWKEQSSDVAPATSRTSNCAFHPDETHCGDLPDCGEVVPSALFPGGLSHRSKSSGASCRAHVATSMHLLEVPEARGVRGLEAVRVSFSGAPTTPGEADTGTLEVWGQVVGSRLTASEVVGTSGRSDWVADPLWGLGLAPEGGDYRALQRDPAAVWSFTTTGDDAVDVASYSVDVRYLAVAD